MLSWFNSIWEACMQLNKQLGHYKMVIIKWKVLGIWVSCIFFGMQLPALFLHFKYITTKLWSNSNHGPHTIIVQWRSTSSVLFNQPFSYKKESPNIGYNFILFFLAGARYWSVFKPEPHVHPAELLSSLKIITIQYCYSLKWFWFCLIFDNLITSSGVVKYGHLDRNSIRWVDHWSIINFV